MSVYRIDNRLIHGQVIESWVPHIGAKVIIVVNDELAADDLQQQIMTLAIPQSVRCIFCSVANAKTIIGAEKGQQVLILLGNCPDARRIWDAEVEFPSLNIGNVHYSPGKKQLSPSVALSPEDENALRFLAKNGVKLDFRCVPNDPVQVVFK